MLNVADYISPECTCNVEDMVAKLDHVASSIIVVVNALLLRGEKLQ